MTHYNIHVQFSQLFGDQCFALVATIMMFAAIFSCLAQVPQIQPNF